MEKVKWVVVGKEVHRVGAWTSGARYWCASTEEAERVAKARNMGEEITNAAAVARRLLRGVK